MNKRFQIISIVVVIAVSLSIPLSAVFARDYESPAPLEIRSELIYMGVGLVLMVVPWVWYFLRRNRDKDDD